MTICLSVIGQAKAMPTKWLTRWQHGG